MAVFSGAATSGASVCMAFSLAVILFISIASPRTTKVGQVLLRGRELRSNHRELLEEEGGVGTLVVLTGEEQMETTQWLKSTSGAFHKQRILHRPGWSRSTRCTGSSHLDNCEECFGSVNCWTPNATSRTVMSTGAGWSRFISAIHVRCNAPTVTFNYEVQKLQGGSLRFFWDNVEVRPQAGFAMQGLASPITDGQAGIGSVAIEVANSGGHTFEVQFVGLSAGASAELAKFELIVPDNYAQCEDFKACLDPLAMNQGTLELRSSNSLQLRCLEVPTTEECVMWQYCLAQSNRREAILELLRAGGVDRIQLPGPSKEDQGVIVANTTTASTTSANGMSEPVAAVDELGAGTTVNGTVMQGGAISTTLSNQQVHTCLNPLLEDAEAWACDCYDEMRERCEQLSSEPFYTKDLCLRALVCDHPRVCAEWKNEACSAADPALQLLLERLQHRRLLERSMSSPVGEETVGLDRVLSGKKCA